MGVINLGLLVEKIKRKLEDSGFIKNTDYATASAAGVVKIGDNIDVTEAGVISVTFPTASGFTVDELWSGDLTNAYADITESLTHPISDYKFLATCRVGGTSAESSQLLYVSKIGSGNNVIGTTGTSIQVKLDSGVFSIKAQSSMTGVTLLGIK